MKKKVIFNHQNKENVGNTLTILISDFEPYSTTQIIQITDSIMKHGFATVVYPFDNISSTDIIWNKNYKDGVKEYPVVERILDRKEANIVNKFITELSATSFSDPYSYTDDYHYVIFINGEKVVSFFTKSVDTEEFPKDIKKLLLDILAIASPIYPNFGIW